MKRYQVSVNGNIYEVEVQELQPGQSAARPMSAPVAAPMVAPVAAPVAQAAAPAPAPATASAPAAPQTAGSKTVNAPMQGKILGIKVAVGDVIKENAVLAILEAMKMENEIVSPYSGTVASINVSTGQTVTAGEVLITLN